MSVDTVCFFEVGYCIHNMHHALNCQSFLIAYQMHDLPIIFDF
jgi:hypothetical protein